jgi:hypothetical protein
LIQPVHAGWNIVRIATAEHLQLLTEGRLNRVFDYLRYRGLLMYMADKNSHVGNPQLSQFAAQRPR